MLEMLEVIKVDIKDLKEWGDNPVNRRSVSDVELRKSIKDNGTLFDAIAVIPDRDGYIVIDGNRRLRIARELNMSVKFFAKVYPKDIDRVAVAVHLNGTGKSWNRQAFTQFVIGHPERIELLPGAYRSATKNMYDLLGNEFEWFALNCRPNAYNWGVQLANYLGKGSDDKFVKKVVLWVGRHQLVREVRRAIDASSSKQMIEKAIANNKALRITVISEE